MDKVDGLVQRGLLESDAPTLKSLHEEFFPVRYADAFFDKVCHGQGLGRGGKLYHSVLCEKESGRMVGFMLAQMFPTESVEDKELFATDPKSICYILTCGIITEYRRHGVGTLLLDALTKDVECDVNCGALYLHVITTNKEAIYWYNKNGFSKIRTLSAFYNIEGIDYDAHLYMYYLNGYTPTLWSWFSSMLSSLWGRVATEKDVAKSEDVNLSVGVTIKCGVRIKGIDPEPAIDTDGV
jgi:ribosomal protein S18 acetylase RimI-like enzyme